jgi:chromate reductase, NAD(P)H dehydrogenase (quinone)
VRILGFAGSFRVASYNRALLAACVELAPAGSAVQTFDLRTVPLYDPDVEARGFPSSVQELRAAIAGADGLLVVTPEYNASLPAVTKNALDWVSRRPRPSPLDGKPAVVMGATPGRHATVRAQAQLRGLLSHTGAYVLPKPEVAFARAEELFSAGRLTDPAARDRVATALAAFVAFAARLTS